MGKRGLETYPLYYHPATGSLLGSEVTCTLGRRRADLLDLTYRVVAPSAEIVVPDGAGLRRDGLWRTTCFELFIGKVGTSAYRELNFSPGGDWAAYEFSGYRQDQRNAAMHSKPSIVLSRGEDFIEVAVCASIDNLADGDPISISAVVEEHGFGLSYWSYWHAGETPDFHHPSCFTLTLPPPAKP